MNEKQLCQLAVVLMGQSPSSSSCSENGAGIPFVQGNAEFGVRYPVPRLRCSAPKRVAEEGDFLLSVRAPVGELNQANQKLVIGRGLSAIRFPTFDQPFSWHSLNSAVYKLNRVAQGSTFAAVNHNDVESLEIPWFPEEAYRRNTSFVLDTIEEAIAKTEAVIAKLKQVRAGILHDLLSYGLDEHGCFRDPIAHPGQFKDSLLGLIPREWEPKSLGILCSHIGSGVTPRGGQDVYTKEGILFIRSQNVTFDGLKLDDIAYIPPGIHIGMLRSEVFAHDVLFNITGASIGRCCAMPGNMGIANVNQHVCILRIPAATELDAVFLSTVLSSKIGQKQLEAFNTCGNRQGLNYQQLGSFTVPWPEREERGLIAGHVKKMVAGLSAEIDELKKLRSLKVGLQDDLLTGRVRVPETIMEGAEHE